MEVLGEKKEGEEAFYRPPFVFVLFFHYICAC